MSRRRRWIPEMIKEVLDTMVGLAQDGMTMVCVTHEMGFARQVADRVVFMDRGEIVESGPPTEMFENPQTDRLAAVPGADPARTLTAENCIQICDYVHFWTCVQEFHRDLVCCSRG